MALWLLKTEPTSFSIENLKAMKVSPWDGVRNHVASGYLRSMAKGELGFFYHSSCPIPGIAGVCKVDKTAYPDFTALDPSSKYFDPRATDAKPRWFMPDVRYVKTFKNFVALEQLRKTAGLEHMTLLRKGMRLSVMPVSETEWQIICLIGDGK